jgi:DUF1680 family protein
MRSFLVYIIAKERMAMKTTPITIVCLSVLGAALAFSQGGGSLKKDYPIRPVDFTKVQITDTFWAPKMKTNRIVTIPFAMKKNEETGRVDNFRKAAGLMKGAYLGKRYNDTDVYKVIEGASYSLLLHPDPTLKKDLDDLIKIIGAAQEPDGYLYTARTVDPKNPAPGAGPERWYYLRGSHELYNSGHMFEAAVAHFLATGEKSFLGIAVKNADMLLRTFGPDKRRDMPGHQEVEIGLAKLYRVTGNVKYLELAKFFLDQRGLPHEGRLYPGDSPFALYNQKEYMQDHRPVLEQDEAVGHAVRAMYMYAGMADVAALGGYPEYVKAIDRLWENVVGKKMYLTGGVGSRGIVEGFGENYELPNSAYAETCAAIGNALWNQRLFLLHGDAKYIDVLERVMYNGLISGVSLDGMLFFYQNPLESVGGRLRSPWFEVACCPPNMTRFLPSVPGYVYGVTDNTLYVNLFVSSTAKIGVGGKKDVEVIQKTGYPWDGSVQIGINPVRVADFTLAVRIPGWARNEPVPGGLYRFADKNDQAVVIRLNNKLVTPPIEKGYALIKRTWRTGDIVSLSIPMPIRRVMADERVKDDAGMAALQRGPIVFCAEGVDNGGDALDIVLPDDAKLQSFFRPDLVGGVEIIRGQAAVVVKSRDGKSEVRKRAFYAVPYFAWANRGDGEMTVWFPRTEAAVRPREGRGKVDPVL